MYREREVVFVTKSDRFNYINLPLAVVVSHSVAATKVYERPFCSLLQKGFDFMKTQKISTRKICLLAIFTAITVLLGIYATFRIGNYIKVPMKFISVFMTGVIFGPIAGGIVASVADVLNAVLVPVGPPLIQITAVEFLYGVIFGLMFHKVKNNKMYYLRAVICGLIQFIIGITLTSKILTDVGYFQSFNVAVGIRLPAALVTLAIHIIAMCILKKFVFRIKAYLTKDGKK